MRELRREEATDRGVPPYLVFDDAALRDMARRRPSNHAAFHMVRGVGEKKLNDFGDLFVAAIVAFCEQNNLTTDVVEDTLANSDK